MKTLIFTFYLQCVVLVANFRHYSDYIRRVCPSVLTKNNSSVSQVSKRRNKDWYTFFSFIFSCFWCVWWNETSVQCHQTDGFNNKVEKHLGTRLKLNSLSLMIGNATVSLDNSNVLYNESLSNINLLLWLFTTLLTCFTFLGWMLRVPIWSNSFK